MVLMKSGFGYEEYSSGGNRPWRMFRSWPNDNRELVGGGGSCFRAGTKITLADGKTAKIEELSEWDRILTLAEPEQYGVMSDERVSHHIDVPLVGFSKSPTHPRSKPQGPIYVFLKLTAPMNRWRNPICHSSSYLPYNHRLTCG